MEKIETSIPGLFLLEPKVFGDDRGYFLESWNRQVFEKLGLDIQFDQDNQSLSQKGVLRGLHFQEPPHAQGKLVRVINGSVLDVAVDLRKDSPTYGKHEAMILSGENKRMFWVPKGFAHGFLCLEDQTLFSYKCQGLYNPAAEKCMAWNDPDLGIDWGIKDPVLSTKDQQGLAFNQYKSPF